MPSTISGWGACLKSQAPPPCALDLDDPPRPNLSPIFLQTRTMQMVWITGAGGLIGGAHVGTASRFAPGWRVRALTRADLDLLDADAVRRRFEQDRPQRVIHCAALSYPPACQ